MGKAAREVRRALNRSADEANAEWPEELVEIDVPEAMAQRMDNPPVRALRSRYFLVQVYEDDTGDDGMFRRLSVQRVEHAAFRTDAVEDPISWDELMGCKSEAGYCDRWAVEVYPPDADVVDVARMRHLFLVSPERLPFRWLPTEGDQP